MNYYAICNETNEHLLNSEGHRIVLSDITKKSFDMFKDEFDLLGDVRLEPVSQYEDVPIYYWYMTREHAEGYNKMYYYKGVTYVGFIDDPEPDVLDRYKLTFVGLGDMTMIGS